MKLPIFMPFPTKKEIQNSNKLCEIKIKHAAKSSHSITLRPGFSHPTFLFCSQGGLIVCKNSYLYLSIFSVKIRVVKDLELQ